MFTITAQRKLLDRLGETPTVEMYGLDLKRETGVSTSSLYVALMRLEGRGLVSSRWDEVGTIGPDRLRRRFYRITHDGRRKRAEPRKRTLRDALADLFRRPGAEAVS